MIELIFKPQGKPQRSVQIRDKQILTVGREVEHVDVHLPEKEVSRRQCRFLLEDGRLSVEPLDGSSPLFLNRKVLTKRATVSETDFVAFGRYRVYPQYPRQPRRPSRAAVWLRSSISPVQQRLKQWSASPRKPRQKIQATTDECEDLRRHAQEWNALGRANRLLLHGRNCRRASKLALPAEMLGNDGDIVMKYIHESLASRRTFLAKLGTNMAVLLLACLGGVVTAHAVTDDLVFNTRPSSTPICDEATLSTLQENATATDDKSESLIRAVEATYTADESNCGYRAAGIERQARELLRTRDHQVFARIDSGVEHLTLSPDDRSVAAVRGDTLEIFTLGEAEPNRLEAELVSSLTWSPDGRLIAGHRGGTVKIWDTHQPQKWQHSFDKPHRGDIVDIAVGRQGNSFASIDNRGEVRLWRLSGGNKDQVIGQGQVSTGSSRRAFIDAAEQILVVQTTESVKVWDLAQSRLGKGERIRISAKPISVALAADGGTILVSDVEGNVNRYRRTKSGRWDRGRIIYGASSPVQFMAYSSTYDRTVVVDNQQLIVLTSKTNRKALPKARLGEVSGKIHQLALTASERVAVTIGSDGAELWDVASTTSTALAHVDSGSNWKSSALSFDNDKVVAAVPKRDIRVWDLPPKSRGSQLLSDHSGGLLALQPSATGFATASTEHGTQTNIVVRAHNNEGLEDNKQTYNPTLAPEVLALNPGGKIVASSSQDGIQIWRTDRSGEPEKTLPFHGTGTVKFLTFAGPSMLVAASDRDIVTWDFSEGRFKPKRWPTNRGEIRSLVATEEHLAIGIQTSPGQNGLVKVWQTNRPKDTQLRFKTDAPVSQVVFSNDGRWLASGTTDGRIDSRSMDSSQKNSYPLGAAITAIDILSAKDQSRIVAGARDGTIALIPGAEDASQIPRSTGIHEPVIGVAFGPSPDIIVAAYQGGDVVKWYAREAAWTSVPLGKHGSKLATLAAPGGGDIVLTLSSPGSEASTLQVWPVSPWSLWRHACEAIGETCSTYERRPQP